MGQRLVINIMDNDKILANAYYHWSGYTSSALNITSKCIDYYKNYKDEFTKETLAVKMLESTGAGLAGTETISQYLKELFFNPRKPPIKPSTDRNSGLIGTAEKDIEESCKWGEEFVDIILNEESVDFRVCYEFDEYEIKENEIDEDELSTINYDSAMQIDFDKFSDFADELDAVGFAFKTKDGVIMGKVE